MMRLERFQSQHSPGGGASQELPGTHRESGEEEHGNPGGARNGAPHVWLVYDLELLPSGEHTKSYGKWP